jgi:SPP1 family predicted phage head-tail adaptor
MIINGKVTNPGEMRTLITLMSRAITKESGAFQSRSTTTIAEVWSKWTNVHGSEAWTAASLAASMPATVLIRWRDDVDASCLVTKGSDLYEIVSLDNIQERNEYIELKVKQVVAG